MLSLSLNCVRVSRMSVVGTPQGTPPSVARLTSTALEDEAPNVGPENAIAIWYAMPLGEMVIHGSDARAKSVPLLAAPPVQRENAADDLVQVWPPSCDTPVRRPRAPPSDQRSCCHTPMRCIGSPGSTSTRGSTSAFT